MVKGGHQYQSGADSRREKQGVPTPSRSNKMLGLLIVGFGHTNIVLGRKFINKE